MASVSVNQKIKGKGLPWRVQWRDQSNRSLQKTFAKKTGEDGADAFAAKLEHELRSSSYVNPKQRRTPFREQCDAWRAERHVSASRMASELSLIDNHVLPRWGDVALEDIDHADLQQWINHMRLKAERTVGRDEQDKPIIVTGYAWETVAELRQIVRHVLADAVRAKKLHTNAAEDVRVPNKPTRDITSSDVLTPDEVQRLVDAAPEQWRAYLFGCCWLGWRSSEGARLRLGDLNLQARNVLIIGTKGAGKVRVVPLPGDVLTALEKHVANHVRDHRPGAYLFATSEGTLADRSNLRRMLQKALRDAGLDDRGIDFRQLRHTAASLMLAAGVHYVDVSYRLGHSRPSITADVYTHLLPHVTQDGTERIEAFMRGER